MEKKTNNELIAEFMGWVFVPTSANGLIKEHYENGNDWMDVGIMYYDTSWDWLMPVVGKIRPLAYEIDIDSTAWRRLSGKSIFSKIEDVYHAVVEFIKWYSSHPPRV